MQKKVFKKISVIMVTWIVNWIAIFGSTPLLAQTEPTWTPTTGNEFNMIVTGNVYLNDVPVSGNGFWVGTCGPGGIATDCRSVSPIAGGSSYYSTIRGNSDGQTTQFILWNGNTAQAFMATESLTFQNDDLRLPFNLHFTGVVNSLTLTSPNGGETWRRGEQKQITWTCQGITENLDIELWQNGVYRGLIASVSPATGTYTWTVGTCQNGPITTGPGCTIRITTKSGAIVSSKVR